MGRERTTFCELKHRDVVNICNGCMLGTVCDLELDLITGNIISIIVPGENKLLGILKCHDDIIIPFCKINKIGEDVILVDLR
ncbi:MAG: YlmC/YmxH family sporulation protein [Clostridiales bacterium]|nr:YlmC/YmxH family sporulation protein [Clostridiales bacterium]